MTKLFYPAVFEGDFNKGYSVFFPDIPGCNTQGESISHAYEMAVDALGLYYLSIVSELNEIIPNPSSPEKISLAANQSIVLVELDVTEYKKKYDNKAVKKTLSIPSWLNKAAIEKGINFSAVLQDAIKNKIGIS